MSAARVQYYKAVRPNGRDFWSDTVQWAPPPGHIGSWIVRHPTATRVGQKADQYLSVSTIATDCTGMAWPARLLVVEEAVGYRPARVDTHLPNKRIATTWRVVGERPGHEALGPQGQQVASLIESAASAAPAVWVVTRTAATDAARDTAWNAALDAARAAAPDAAWDAAWDASRYVAGDAAIGLVARDLIPTQVYDTLTMPWRTHVGRIHPDDPQVTP